MDQIDWYSHPQYLPDEVKTLTESEAAYALKEAWYQMYGSYPKDESLAVLWAKSALETGRWKFIHCFNFGNIKKKRSPDDGHYFTMFRCSEILNGKEIWFDPPHYQTHFRAYKTIEDGATDYLQFVANQKRYAAAWQKVIEGDPKGYSHELKKAGYYTASESRYTAGVVRLFNEFMKKKDSLLSWKPKDTDPSPPPAVEVDVVIPKQSPVPKIEEVIYLEEDQIKATPSKKVEDRANVTVLMMVAAAIGSLITALLQYL